MNQGSSAADAGRTDLVVPRPRLGFVGGTGPLGRGLALRFARAGYDVAIGSRSAERALEVVAGFPQLSEHVGDVAGATNDVACSMADVVFVTVPFDALDRSLEAVRDGCDGKTVVSCVNALAFDARGPYPVPVAAGSAAEAVQAALPGSQVTCAFNSVSAKHLGDPGAVLDEDVLVCGDDPAEVGITVGLVDAIPGLRGVAVGPLRLAGTVEAVTAVILSINRRVKRSVGLRVSGLPDLA